MRVVNAIRRLRSSLRLTQRELAEKAGVTERAIRRYEAGQRDPEPGPLAVFAALAAEADLHDLTGYFTTLLLDRLRLANQQLFVVRFEQPVFEQNDPQSRSVSRALLLVSWQGVQAEYVKIVSDALAVLFYGKDDSARGRVEAALRDLEAILRLRRKS